MPRQARLDAPGTLHHVMVRGIEGTPLFLEDKDRESFLSRLGELAQETETRIVAWTLMSNHVHLLLFSGPEGLARFMGRLLTGYAVRYNLKYDRKGHLFQNRYKSIVCEEDGYLLELVRYIHLNPVRARVVGSMRDLDQYAWSGHGVILGRYLRPWQDRDYVLEQFGGSSGQAIRAYRRFMEEGKDQGRREELSGGGLIRSVGGWSQVVSLRRRGEAIEYDARVLGGSDFVDEILKEADRKLRRQIHVGGGKLGLQRVIGKMCEEAGIRERELQRGGQRREVSRLRGRIAYVLCREMGVSMAEAARELGVCATAIVKALQKLEFEEEK